MNRLFTILCMVAVLVFHTSCSDSILVQESPSIEMKTPTMDQKVQNLIQQARQGNVEAYKSLALCYRDGDGVEQSLLNMVYMYNAYIQKSGRDIMDIIEDFDKEDPFGLILEMLYSNEIAKEKMDQLRQSAPAEAKVLEVAKKIFSEEDLSSTLRTIREAEDEGSELAILFQTAYYELIEDDENLLKYLIRHAEKYPFLNSMIAYIYSKKFEDDEDFSNIKKSIEYYYKADAYGMLNYKGAIALCELYGHYGKQGLLEYNEVEVERLKKLTPFG